MDHLSQKDLADYDRLKGERKAQIEEHLRTCDVCREAVESQMRLLTLLDGLAFPEMSDQTQGVLSTMAMQKAKEAWDWPVLMKAAAAVVLSTGMGYYAGHFSRPANNQPKADPQQAARMLYLDELGVGPTGEFRNLFLTTDAEQEISG